MKEDAMTRFEIFYGDNQLVAFHYDEEKYTLVGVDIDKREVLVRGTWINGETWHTTIVNIPTNLGEGERKGVQYAEKFLFFEGVK